MNGCYTCNSLITLSYIISVDSPNNTVRVKKKCLYGMSITFEVLHVIYVGCARNTVEVHGCGGEASGPM